MTIRARNIFVLILLFFSLAISVCFAIWTVLSFLNGTFAAYPMSVPATDSKIVSALLSIASPFPALSNFFTKVLSYNFSAVLFSIFALSFTMPVTMVLIYTHFEKTQSQECVYFSAFLLACLAESIRLVIPLESLWDSNTTLLFFCAKIIFFGRITAPLSFLFFVISTAIGQTSESGKHFFVILMLSLLFALIIPVNTLHVLPTCSIEFGFRRMFDAIKTVLFVLTLLAFFLNAREKQSSDNTAFFLGAGYAVLFSGYSILLFSDTFLTAVFGVFLLGAGSILHLQKIHKIYRWE